MKLVIAAIIMALMTGAAPVEPERRIDWRVCADDIGMECAELSVPVDWDKPGGRRLTLAVARLKANGRAKGTVLLAFGGPTGRYLDILRVTQSSFVGLRRHMHVVTWSLRGLPDSVSTPKLTCDVNRVRHTPPGSEADFAELAQSNRTRAEACRAQDPDLFDSMGSDAHARDMEAIRRALGEARLNLYMASYGGAFGQSYAQLFPHRIRTMVLDGTMNRSEDFETELDALAADYDAVMRRFFAWCAGETTCALHGRDASAVWLSVLARAEHRPISGFDAPTLRELALARAMRGPQMWHQLAEAIAAAQDRDDASGLAFAPGHPNPPGYGLGLTECLDYPQPQSYADYRQRIDRLERIAPHTGAARTMAATMLYCAGWPTAPTSLPQRLRKHISPLLAAGAWVEYTAAARAVSQVRGSGAIEHDGPGHTLYGNNECARALIDSYLIELAVPPPGTTC